MWLVSSFGIFKNADWAIPHFTSVKDEIGGIVGNFIAGLTGVDFVGVFSLIPDDLNLITGVEFGKVVEGI